MMPPRKRLMNSLYRAVYILALAAILLCHSTGYSYAAHERLVTFVKSYQPFQNNDTSLTDIMSAYVASLFTECSFEGFVVTGKNTLTARFRVGKLRSVEGMDAFTIRKLRSVQQGTLNLQWEVDEDYTVVTPANFYARDVIDLMQDTLSVLFGVRLILKY